MWKCLIQNGLLGTDFIMAQICHKSNHNIGGFRPVPALRFLVCGVKNIPCAKESIRLFASIFGVGFNWQELAHIDLHGNGQVFL
jgi:hypothetical protein